MLGHLPERLHASVGKALRDAWDLDSADRAARVLERLAGSLERDHPGAAASLREGLDETLTVQRLGLTGALQRTLRSTNIIENLNGSVERYTRNVKRWRGGQMIQRWVASALVEAEKHFRRVRGYRDLPHLVVALDALAPPDGVVADVAQHRRVRKGRRGVATSEVQQRTGQPRNAGRQSLTSIPALPRPPSTVPSCPNRGPHE